MPIRHLISTRNGQPRLTETRTVWGLVLLCVTLVGCGASAPAHSATHSAPALSLSAGVPPSGSGSQGSHPAAGTTLTSNPAAASASGTGSFGRSSVSSQAVDIYAYTGHSNPVATVASLPSVVNGVSWVFRWKDIEPSHGVYDWSSVDAAISASASSGRKTMLRIDAGAYTPSWEPNQLTFSFKPTGPRGYMKVTMPRTWDPTYVADWLEFIRAYGARYDKDARVTRIQMAGGGWLGEMGLPQWPGWINAGYTDALMTSAWEKFISAYRTAFPHHPSALDFSEPLSVYYHSNITPTVIAYAARYGSMVNLQENGLEQATNESGTVFQTILHYAATTKVGWQMWAGNISAANLMIAFEIAVDSRASYVEVYLNNCTNPADLPALKYLAHG